MSKQNLIKIGTTLQPEGGPLSSAIEVTAIKPDGVECLRLHPHWKNESFFLRWDQFEKSHWIPIE